MRETWRNRYRAKYSDEGDWEVDAKRMRGGVSSFEETVTRVAAQNVQLEVDRQLIEDFYRTAVEATSIEDVLTKGIPIPRRLISLRAGDDIGNLDPEVLKKMISDLDEREAAHLDDYRIDIPTMRLLVNFYRHWRPALDTDEATRNAYKELAEQHLAAEATDPELGKTYLIDTTEWDIPLSPYAPADTIFSYLDTEMAPDPKFIKACLGEIEKEGVLRYDTEGVMVKGELFPGRVFTRESYEEALKKLQAQVGKVDADGELFTQEIFEAAKEKFMSVYAEKPKKSEDFWNLSADYDYLTEKKMAALGISESFLTDTSKKKDPPDHWVSDEKFQLTLHEIARTDSGLASLRAAVENDRLPKSMPMRCLLAVQSLLDEPRGEEQKLLVELGLDLHKYPDAPTWNDAFDRAYNALMRRQSSRRLREWALETHCKPSNEKGIIRLPFMASMVFTEYAGVTEDFADIPDELLDKLIHWGLRNNVPDTARLHSVCRRMWEWDEPLAPKGFERGELLAISAKTDTGRFSSQHPNEANPPRSRTPVERGAPVYFDGLDGTKVTLERTVCQYGASPIGRIVKPGETVAQGMVNTYELKETGEDVDVLLNMGPDSYVVKKGDPTPPEWCKPAMQWFLFDTAEEGLVMLQEPNAFIVDVFDRQIQGSSWEFTGVDADGAKELRVVLTGADFLRPAWKASYERAQHAIRIRTAINYSYGWACKVTGTVTRVEDVPGDPDPDKAIVTFKLQDDFRAGPVDGWPDWPAESPTGRTTKSEPEMQNIPASIEKMQEELKKRQMKVRPLSAESCPGWLLPVREQMCLYFYDDDSWHEYRAHYGLRDEFSIEVDGEELQMGQGAQICFDHVLVGALDAALGLGVRTVGVRPVIRMEAHQLFDTEVGRRLDKAMTEMDGPMHFIVRNRRRNWQLDCKGAWITEQHKNDSSARVSFSLSVVTYEVGEVPSGFNSTCTPLDYGSLLHHGSSSTGTPNESQSTVVDRSADHELVVLQRRQIDRAKAQLLSSSATTALTYLVPKDPNDG